MAATSPARLLSDLAERRRLSSWVSIVVMSARTSSSSSVARASTGFVSPGTSGSSKARRTTHSASTSRIPARKRFPRPSPVDDPGTSPAMSTTSMPARTTLRLELIWARASRRASGSGAAATVVSVVVNGCEATAACAPVRALNNDVLPALGRPTRPRRSIDRDAIGWPTVLCRPSALSRRRNEAVREHGGGPARRSGSVVGHVQTHRQAQDPEQEEGEPRQAAQLRPGLSPFRRPRPRAALRAGRPGPSPRPSPRAGWAGRR